MPDTVNIVSFSSIILLLSKKSAHWWKVFHLCIIWVCFLTNKSKERDFPSSRWVVTFYCISLLLLYVKPFTLEKHEMMAGQHQIVLVGHGV